MAVKTIVLMVALDWLFRMINQFIDTELDKKVKRLEYGAIQRLFYKMSVLNYELLDDADTKDKFGKATKCVMALNFYELILSVRTFFSSILVLFGVIGIIASVDAILLIVISLVIIANAYANSRLKKYRKLSDLYYSLLDHITESEGIVKYIGIILSSLQEGRNWS